MSDQTEFLITMSLLKQTCDENKEKYQFGDYKLIYWIPSSSNQHVGIVWKTVRGTTIEILGVKELSFLGAY